MKSAFLKGSLIPLVLMELSGCESVNNLDVEGVLPPGFNALSLPRRSIPIGAIWRPGLGPDGVGVDSSNLYISGSASRITLDSSISADFELSIINYLNLSTAISNDIEVEATNLILERVDSLEVIGVSSGQQILYEGVKAENININYSAAIEAELKAKIGIKGLPITLDVNDSGGNKSITLDGKDLYIAYRVVEFQEIDVKRSKKDFAYEGTARLAPYDVELDFEKLGSCMCTPGKYQACLDSVPAYVGLTNYNDVILGQGVYQEKIELKNGWPFRVPVKSYLSGNTVTFDSLIVAPIYDPGMSTNGDFRLCVPGVDDDSYVELIRSRFRLVGVDNAEAPGW